MTKPAANHNANAASAADIETLMEAIRHRRSMGLARLAPDPVDRALIERVLEAANWAPSHGDTEPWRFTIFMGEGREALANLFEAANLAEKPDLPPEAARAGAHKRAFGAPVWIAVGMSPGREKDGSLEMPQHEEMMAVASAVQNLHLMASAQGLAGMWHSKGPSIHPTVAHGLGLEPPDRLLGFFMLGWPNTEWFTGERRPLSEKVRWVEEP
jgi:nitroreductase